MTRASQPTTLPADVYDSAVEAAAIASRTVPQQIAHWARIGREVEMSPEVNHRAITSVLSGSGSYDALDAHEQALVREGWATRATARREALNYEARFTADGESYSETDDAGRLVVRGTAG